VVELAGDLVLVLDLLDEAQVLVVGAHDVLERVGLLRVGVADGVDGASRTFPQALQNIIVEDLLGHALLFRHGCWSGPSGGRGPVGHASRG
jgi:hypothetical protein